MVNPFKCKIYYPYFKKITCENILNYVPYLKEDAIATLEKECGWKYYGDKHYESIFTRFYHAYILPTKFGIDTRRSHLSTLVCSGQMTRDEALKIIEYDPYTCEELKEDKEYVLSKLGLMESDFEDIMNLPVKSSSLLRTAIKDYWLAEAQSHCSLRVLTVTVPLASTVDKNLGAFDHQTFD